MIDVPESIKQLYIEGLAPKRVQIIFPNGEHTAIGNEHIVAESLEFRENLSQGDTFKFGICEASMIKFDAYDIPNLKGFKIKVFHGIYSEELGWYDIPLGVFDVTEQKIDKKTGKNTVTAYTQSLVSSNICGYEKFRTQEVLHMTSSDHVFNLDVLAMEIGLPAPAGSTTSMFASTDFEKVTTWLEENWNYVDSSGTSGEGHFGLYNFKRKENNPARNVYRFTIDHLDLDERARKALEEEMRAHFNAKPFKILVPVDGEWFVYEFGLNEWIPFELDSVQTVLIFTGRIAAAKPHTFPIDVGYEFDINFADCFERVTVPAPQFFYKTVDFNQVIRDGNVRYYKANAKQIEDLDFAKMLISYFEIQGKILRYDRNGHPQLVDVQQANPENIYPAYDIYPSNTTYPEDDSGVIGRYFKNNYSEMDIESTEISGIGTVAVKYKCSDINDPNNGKEVLYKYKASDSKSVYQMDDNFFCLKYNEYESGEGIRAYSAEDFARNIGEQTKDVHFVPFTLDAQALPWIEVGDTVRINTSSGMVNSIVFSRAIKGIQALNDELTAPNINTDGLYLADSSITEE